MKQLGEMSVVTKIFIAINRNAILRWDLYVDSSYSYVTHLVIKHSLLICKQPSTRAVQSMFVKGDVDNSWPVFIIKESLWPTLPGMFQTPDQPML